MFQEGGAALFLVSKISAGYTWHSVRIGFLEKPKADSDKEVEGENGETQAAESLKCS